MNRRDFADTTPQPQLDRLPEQYDDYEDEQRRSMQALVYVLVYSVLAVLCAVALWRMST